MILATSITIQECGLLAYGYLQLGFSWQSGAKFFEDNLLDFCPASNTLSWRWVAGVQTIGKPYIARAENIKEFTKGKFYPKNQLKENHNLNFDNLSNGWPY